MASKIDKISSKLSKVVDITSLKKEHSQESVPSYVKPNKPVILFRTNVGAKDRVDAGLSCSLPVGMERTYKYSVTEIHQSILDINSIAMTQGFLFFHKIENDKNIYIPLREIIVREVNVKENVVMIKFLLGEMLDDETRRSVELVNCTDNDLPPTSYVSFIDYVIKKKA